MYRTIEMAMLYWADVAIATYEDAANKKSTSNTDRRRLLKIATQMIDDCNIFCKDIKYDLNVYDLKARLRKAADAFPVKKVK